MRSTPLQQSGYKISCFSHICCNYYVFRFDAQTGADREVQRILLELLNQMDGFDQTG